MIIQLTEEEWKALNQKISDLADLVASHQQVEGRLLERIKELEDKVRWMKLPDCPEGYRFNTQTGECD